MRKSEHGAHSQFKLTIEIWEDDTPFDWPRCRGDSGFAVGDHVADGRQHSEAG